jgi:Holliday junction resolvase RusA-like endonuclease
MNKIAFRDDAQIVRSVFLKRYGETPQLEVTFHRWAPK